MVCKYAYSKKPPFIVAVNKYSTNNLLKKLKMMTTEQRIKKFLYPLILFYSRLTKKNLLTLKNLDNKLPDVPFYSLKALSNTGQEISFEEYRGKKVMLVNVASNCGYTGQYNSLEQLYKNHKDNLIILGFPANDFNNQEPSSDEAIERFCRINFGVTFPLFKKGSVLRPHQGTVYKWLSDKKQNGWNNQQPIWNFSKYLINENGMLTHFFGAAVEPKAREIEEALTFKIVS
jgi:glutathione peroxidase